MVLSKRFSIAVALFLGLVFLGFQLGAFSPAPVAEILHQQEMAGPPIPVGGP